MPLQPCYECGEAISVHARTCPHCEVRKPFQSGLQRGLNKTSSVLFWIGLAGLLLLLLLMC